MSLSSGPRPCGLGLLLVATLTWAACAPADSGSSSQPTGTEASRDRWEIESPAGRSSFAPNLLAGRRHLYLSWLEEENRPAGERHHRLWVSRRQGDRWSAAVVVAEGNDFFANWADLPAVAESADGILHAHWLAKTGADTYAYSIYLARSEDGGTSWTATGALNDDETETEHGFVSFLGEEGEVRAFWLDGREMAAGGPMGLRTTIIGDGASASELLDGRVCECCGTDAAMTATGPVVVTRGRSTEEIRDIVIVRRVEGSWTTSQRVAVDDWQIEGCPVNGPVVAAAGEAVAVAWYTAAGTGPRVQIVFSKDAGETFDPPITFDSGRPLGRVDIVEDGMGGFVVSWLEAAGNRAEIRLRRFDAAGVAGEPLVAARTAPSRASGFPRLARIEGDAYLAWVDVESEDASRVRLLKIPLSEIG